MIYEQLLELQKQDAIELSYNAHPLSDYTCKKANSSIVKQLAEMLGIGITLAYRLVKQKTIQSIKVGREYKIPKHCVINYLEKSV